MSYPGSTDEEREAGKSQGRARSHGGGWQNETVSRASVLRTPLFWGHTIHSHGKRLAKVPNDKKSPFHPLLRVATGVQVSGLGTADSMCCCSGHQRRLLPKMRHPWSTCASALQGDGARPRSQFPLPLWAAGVAFLFGRDCGA